MLRGDQVLEGKNIHWSHFKVIITNFKWILMLPGYPPSFCSVHSPRWLCHTSPLPLNLQNLLPLPNLSWWSCFFFHWENKSFRKGHPQALISKYIIPSPPVLMCSDFPPVIVGELSGSHLSPHPLSPPQDHDSCNCQIVVYNINFPLSIIFFPTAHKHVIMHPILKI